MNINKNDGIKEQMDFKNAKAKPYSHYKRILNPPGDLFGGM